MPLLAPDEPPAVYTLNAGGRGSAVLVCDHASNRLPRSLGNLGLATELLDDHIAWDPGAADVARRLSAHLDSTLLLSGYSRLVIDCNRPLESPQSIPEQSAGVPIPGNLGLTPFDTEARITGCFRPYHDAIDSLLDQRAYRPTVLLSIHSFTPFLDGLHRPWQIGVSSWRDARLATLIRAALNRSGDLSVGDNEPYPIDEAVDYTVPVHGEGRGLPSVMIEIRQDEIRSSAAAAHWAARLADAYRQIEAEALKLWGP
jgi:predicted N-formylglutamate amidohydrolase